MSSTVSSSKENGGWGAVRLVFLLFAVGCLVFRWQLAAADHTFIQLRNLFWPHVIGVGGFDFRFSPPVTMGIQFVLFFLAQRSVYLAGGKEGKWQVTGFIPFLVFICLKASTSGVIEILLLIWTILLLFWIMRGRDTRPYKGKYLRLFTVVLLILLPLLDIYGSGRITSVYQVVDFPTFLRRFLSNASLREKYIRLYWSAGTVNLWIYPLMIFTILAITRQRRSALALISGRSQEKSGKDASAAKAKADQGKKTKAEQDKKAKADSEKKTKAEQDKKTKEDQEAKAKAEAEKKSKAEADRAAQEEKDRIAKEALEAKVQAEAERKARIEADRIIKEAEQKAKAEADRIIKEAEQKAKEAKAEAERSTKEPKEKTPKAKDTGAKTARKGKKSSETKTEKQEPQAASVPLTEEEKSAAETMVSVLDSIKKEKEAAESMVSVLAAIKKEKEESLNDGVMSREQLFPYVPEEDFSRAPSLILLTEEQLKKSEKMVRNL